MNVNRARFLATATAATAAAIAPAAARGADMPLVRIGVIPADVGAAAAYARDLGYFKNAGLNVDLQVMQSGPSIAPAVLAGSLDVGAMNSGSLAGARERGLPLLYFAPAALVPLNSMTNVMMVRGDSPIHTGADMNGKTVGIVAVKTLEHATMLLWVDKHGGDSRTLKYVELPYGEMSAALEAGRVDIVMPSEPFTSEFRGKNRVVAGTFSAMPGPFIAYGFFATEAWLGANTDVAMRFANALRLASTWANAHQKESAQLLAQFVKLDPKIAATMARTTYASALDASAIQPAIDVMVRYNMLPRTIDANELIWKPARA
jgi:NitT/TauT family transport system substrate-binding protein